MGRGRLAEGKFGELSGHFVESCMSFLVKMLHFVEPALKLNDAVSSFVVALTRELLFHSVLYRFPQEIIVHKGIRAGKQIILPHEFKDEVNEWLQHGLAVPEDVHPGAMLPIRR